MSETTAAMSFREHLRELRTRVFKATTAIAVGFFVAWALRVELYTLLSAPIREAMANNNLFAIKALQITESIEVYMKLSLFGGVILASPFVFYQIWAFVAPGLLDKEKRLVVPILSGSVACFLLGTVFCYLIVLPFMTDFLIKLTVEAPGMTLEPTLASTISFSVMMLLAFGAVFELPLFMYVLAALGLVTAKGFLGFYRYWVVIAFIIGAVLTPTPDPINQTLMSAPLVVLYGVGVIIAWLVQRQPDQRVSRRTLVIVAAVLAALAATGVSYALRAREPGPLDAVPANVRQILGIQVNSLKRLPQQWRAGSDAAQGLGLLALLPALDVKPDDAQVFVARFDKGSALVLNVADAPAVVRRLAKQRKASVVTTGAGISVWFAVPGFGPWRATAAGKKLLWLGEDSAMEQLVRTRTGQQPALTSDRALAQRLDELRTSAPLWAYVGSSAGVSGWMPAGALADSVRTASASTSHDEHEMLVQLECKGPDAALAVRDRLEAWLADRRGGSGPISRDEHLREQVRELADLVARATEAASRTAPRGPDQLLLAASAQRAGRIVVDLSDSATERQAQSAGRAPDNAQDRALAQAAQAPTVSSLTVQGPTVLWSIRGEPVTLLDVLLAPAQGGLPTAAAVAAGQLPLPKAATPAAAETLRSSAPGGRPQTGPATRPSTAPAP